MLPPGQIAVLRGIYKVYRLKGRVQRKVIETAFKAATGKDLGPKYYSIPVVKQLIELAS
jgi:hypothetical protein